MSEDDARKQDSNGQPDLPVSVDGDAERKTAQAIKASGNPNSITGDEPDNPPSPWFHRFMHKHFPDASPHDHWTLLFTAVIAFSTLIYTLASVWTLVEIRAGGVDTHNLAVAAANQASHTEEIAQAAQDQVDAANEISDAADSFSETAETAVEEFRKAADQSAGASKQSATNAERTIKNAQESFRNDQRAWVGIGAFRIVQFEEQKPLKLEVEIVNSGKTPARHVEEWGKYNFSRISQLGPLPTHLIDLKWVPEGSVPPQGHQTINLEVPWNTWKQYEAPVKFRTTYASFFGEISYDDVGDKSHRTQFCFYMSDPDLHTLWFCDQWNDMN